MSTEDRMSLCGSLPGLEKSKFYKVLAFMFDYWERRKLSTEVACSNVYRRSPPLFVFIHSNSV